MTFRTHFLAGVTSGLALAGQKAPEASALAAGIAGIAALLPDLDHPHSFLGRMVPILSWTIKLTSGHRGLLHSIAGMAVFTLAAYFFLGYVFPGIDVCSQILPSFIAGFTSHLVLDTFSGGVMWFYPVKKEFSLPVVQTGGLLEKLVVMPVLAVTFIGILWPIL